MTAGEPVLSVRQLRTAVETGAEPVYVVDGVSFDVMPGELYGIGGETGAGKSMTALSIVGLLPNPPVRVASGSVRWKGQELLGLGENEMWEVRKSAISMIVQDPLLSLTPMLTVGRQIGDAIQGVVPYNRALARSRAVECLDQVGIVTPEEVADQLPHRLLGPVRARVAIALAMATEPELVIADDLVADIDATARVDVLDALRRVAASAGTAVILISRDLRSLAGFADRVGVMYAGQLVEEAPAEDFLHCARMPYTWDLLDTGSADEPVRVAFGPRGPAGRVRGPWPAGHRPALLHPPDGCRFHPRCRHSDGDRCRRDEPDCVDIGDGHWARCHFAADPGLASPAEKNAIAPGEDRR